jgi:hypothetical protein
VQADRESPWIDTGSGVESPPVVRFELLPATGNQIGRRRCHCENGRPGEFDTSVPDLSRRMCSQLNATPCSERYSTRGFSDDCGFHRFPPNLKLPSSFQPSAHPKHIGRPASLAPPQSARCVSKRSALPLFCLCLFSTARHLSPSWALSPEIPLSLSMHPQVQVAASRRFPIRRLSVPGSRSMPPPASNYRLPAQRSLPLIDFGNIQSTISGSSSADLTTRTECILRMSRLAFPLLFHKALLRTVFGSSQKPAPPDHKNPTAPRTLTLYCARKRFGFTDPIDVGWPHRSRFCFRITSRRPSASASE